MPPAGQPLDTVGTTKYPVVLSDRLLNSGTGGYSYASVQVNHAPKSAASGTITASSNGGENCDLTVVSAEEGQKYTYTGSQHDATSAGKQNGTVPCLLIFNPETQTFTLDRLDSEFRFNVRSTPDNRNAKALATSYPQLETTAPDPQSSDEDLFDEDQFSEGDPDNPYDYRHYLKRRRTSSPDALESLEPLEPVEPEVTTTSPVQESRHTKQRNHRRLSTPPREEADADNEDSSDGGLEIVMDGAAKPRHRFRGTFANRSDKAPISLRSAASSVSPAIKRLHDSSEESDEDMEDANLPPSTLRNGPVLDEEDEDMAQQEGDDDDDDLEAELARELEKEAADPDEDADGVVVPRYVEESSSESEEE